MRAIADFKEEVEESNGTCQASGELDG